MNQHDEDIAAAGKRRVADQRLGAFVTNKWLVGILVGLCISLGGYIFQVKDRTTDAQASVVMALQRQINDQAVEIAGLRATNSAQYMEILRRLERIERNQDTPLARRRTEAPFRD